MGVRSTRLLWDVRVTYVSSVLLRSSGSRSRWRYRWIIRSARLRVQKPSKPNAHGSVLSRRNVFCHRSIVQVRSRLGDSVLWLLTTVHEHHCEWCQVRYDGWQILQRGIQLTCQQCALAVTAELPETLKRPLIFSCDELDFLPNVLPAAEGFRRTVEPNL